MRREGGRYTYTSSVKELSVYLGEGITEFTSP